MMKRFHFLLLCLFFALIFSCERSYILEEVGTPVQEETSEMKTFTDAARKYYGKTLKKTMETSRNAGESSAALEKDVQDAGRQ